MGKANLLVIDDEPNILTTVKRALEIEGYAVHVASSGQEGLAKIADAEIDLVLLDVVMPAMDGLSVLAEVRKRFPGVFVVMMSGNASIETAVQATKLGAHDFIEKPLSSDKLLITIQNTLSFAALSRENATLKAQAQTEFAMIGTSPMIRSIFDKITKTAPTNGRVLITGENGTGKELVARAIHHHSKRSKGPFIKLNCAAIPSELVESELFGHEKGAFTGATQKRQGKFELADGGTLFLDEVGDMSLAAQAKVLRVLQEGEIERVGGDKTIKADVRVLAATNKVLATEIEAGQFREDLFYRLNVVPIEVPPLRERRADIPELVKHFLSVVCAANDKKDKIIESSEITMLMQYEWPGNIRELKNVVERLVILTGDAEKISAADVVDALPAVKPISTNYRRNVPLKELVAGAEREIIQQALGANEYHISNTAKELQLERSHLYKKMKSLGIDPRSESV